MSEKNYSATITFGGLIGSTFKAATGGVSRAMDGLKKRYKDTRKELSQVNKELAKGGGNVVELTARKAALEAQMTKLKSRMDILGSSAKINLGGAFGKLKDSIFNLRNGMLALGVTTAAGLGFKQLFATMKKGDDIAETAVALGITTDELQKLRFAARDVGLPMEDMDSLMNRMTIGLVDAKDRSSEFSKSLLSVGLTYSDLAGRDLTDNIMALSDAFRSFDYDPERQNKFLKAFGVKNVMKMRALLSLSRKDLQKKMDESVKFNMKPEDIKAASELDDTINRITSAVESLRDKAIKPFLPIAKQLGDEFLRWTESDALPAVERWSKRVTEWWSDPANQKAVFDGIKKFTDGIISFKDTVISAVDAVGGWGNALKILTAVYFAPVIAGVLSLSSELLKLTRVMWGLVTANAALGGAAGAGWLTTMLGGLARFTPLLAAVGGVAALTADANKNAPSRGTIGAFGAKMFAGRTSQRSIFSGSLSKQEGAAISSDIDAKIGDILGLGRSITDAERRAPMTAEQLAKLSQWESSPEFAKWIASPTTNPATIGMAPAGPGGAPSISSTAGPVSITINQQPWQSSKDLVDEIMRAMGIRQRTLAMGALHD